jgi:MoaA/NifB/PqqE/SkfB family radical SAM enzyme
MRGGSLVQETLPSGVRLDFCTFCQLSCPECSVGKGDYGDFGKGYLKFDDFVKFVEMNPFVQRIEIANRGEIFLNPDLSKIMEFAHAKNILLTAMNSVNFNTVSDDVIESMVVNQFLALSINVDAVNQKAYEQYRYGGNFSTVINNIKKLWICKKTYSSDLPIVNLLYLVFKHNSSREELRAAKKMAQELDATLHFCKDRIFYYIPEDTDMIYEETGLTYPKTTFEYEDNFTRAANPPCLDLWKFPSLNYDGKFLGCHYNGTGISDLNVFEQGLKKCLESEAVQKTKKMLLGGEICEESPCCLCWHYRQFVWHDAFITIDEIGA